MDIQLGSRYKDAVSGFTGIAVARHIYLSGCERVSLQPTVGEDGKLPDNCAFDAPQLELVAADVAPEGPKDVGGPDKYEPEARSDGAR